MSLELEGRHNSRYIYDADCYLAIVPEYYLGSYSINYMLFRAKVTSTLLPISVREIK